MCSGDGGRRHVRAGGTAAVRVGEGGVVVTGGGDGGGGGGVVVVSRSQHQPLASPSRTAAAWAGAAGSTLLFARLLV